MIYELLPADALADAVREGLVRVQRHPSAPLRVFNYTEQAVYTRAWTPVTRACRGLIAHDDGRVVARPWPKFFNHAELEGGSLDLSAPVEVTDKADGSLGILYRLPTEAEPATATATATATAAVLDDDGWAVATRGSFSSEQALHATEVYRSRYAQLWTPVGGWTYLFEIVYPENRIVLDYGGLDDLILLGSVEITTGRCAGPLESPCAGWPGPRIAVHDHVTLADALAARPRPNAEGLVVRYLDGVHAGTMVKIKQDDYVALHRLVTGLSARRLWERAAVHAIADSGLDVRRIGQTLHLDVTEVHGILDAGPQWLDVLRQRMPEEFTGWIETTTAGLREQVDHVLDDVLATATQVGVLDRRAAAAAIAAHPHRGMVFAALDGKPFLAQAWASVRPVAERPLWARSEEVA